jgi:hypothetical protein
LPDELPPELFWAPELEPVPDAVASPVPPSSPAGIELPDELPAPVETPLADDDPHAAIDDGTHANARRVQQTRQFMEGETSRLAEALVSTVHSGIHLQVGVSRFETGCIDDRLSVRRKGHPAPPHRRNRSGLATALAVAARAPIRHSTDVASH